MITLFLRISTLYIICFYNTLAIANQIDSKYEIHITADSVQLNQNHNWVIYIGHVIMQQEDMQLRADRVTTQYDNQHKLQTITAIGNPAHFKWHANKHSELLITEADTIIYQPQAQQLTLKGHAQAQQGANKLASPLLEYDMHKQVLLSPANPKGRTTITIQTQNKE